MPTCNVCGGEFDADEEPGALMFGSPSTTREAVPVWKVHICQECGKKMVDSFVLKPKRPQR